MDKEEWIRKQDFVHTFIEMMLNERDALSPMVLASILCSAGGSIAKITDCPTEHTINLLTGAMHSGLTGEHEIFYSKLKEVVEEYDSKNKQ